MSNESLDNLNNDNGVFHDLTDAEKAFATGTRTIHVIGRPPVAGNGPGAIFGPGVIGNEGGGDESGQVEESPVEPVPDCIIDSRAKAIADQILATLPPGSVGPFVNTRNSPNWTNAEFISFLGASGQVGPQFVVFGVGANVGTLPTGELIQGYIHNHPQFIYDSRIDEFQELSPDQLSENRYPSQSDWQALQAIADASFGFVSDPSLYLLGPDGETRKFQLAERAAIEALTAAQMRAGVGLAGRNNLNGC